MFPEKIIQYCDDLETALREYQTVLEVLMTPRARKIGIDEHLRTAFHKVRDSYIPLEPLLARRTRRVKRNGRESSEPWLDVPTFWGIRTVEDYEAVSRDLDFLMLEISLPNRHLAVHQELRGYFESIDTLRREAERQIRYASDVPPNTADANMMETLPEDSENCNDLNPRRGPDQAPKKGKSLGKPPSNYEIHIYRAHLNGLKQQEIATLMQAQTGMPCDQSKVSRAIKKIDLLLKKGNSDIKTRILPVDPSKLEQGYRLDGRKPKR